MKMAFTNQQEEVEFKNFLGSWRDDPHNVKQSFFKIKEQLLKKENTIFSFKARPGITYSLRAIHQLRITQNRALFALVDVIDDDPSQRWLSICFYVDMITDTAENGYLIPKGILGEDGYCFDLYQHDEAMVSYIQQRIDEAHAPKVKD